jgi:GT2 family glycosyltransferase
MTQIPTLDIVIVNWNTGDCLRMCLESVAGSVGARLGRVVVVDNASTDDSATRLPALDGLVLEVNRHNRGFAAACNQGARQASAPYVLFLNPDTVLQPDTLRAATDCLDSAASAFGICGGVLEQPDGTPGVSASRFPSLANVVTSTLGLHRVLGRRARPRHLSATELQRSGPVDQVIGAFFLVRRALFEQLGGFDERFFVYYEEVDFCRRAAAVGKPAYLCTDVRLTHVGNVSARQSGGRSLFYSLRSRTRYAAKHWPRSHLAVLMIFTVLIELPARIVRALVGRRGREAIDLVRTGGRYLTFVTQEQR